MSTRVKLDLGAFGRQRKEWLVIEHQTATVQEVTAQISAQWEFGPNLELHLDGCLLPAHQSVAIFRDGDVIKVVRKGPEQNLGEDTLTPVDSAAAAQDNPDRSDIMEPASPQDIFPNEIWENIFSNLRDADKKSLLVIRETCIDFDNWVTAKTTLWDRISLHRAVFHNKVDICRKIVEYAQNKNPSNRYGETALHRAARDGKLQICSVIMAKLTDKNPANNLGVTPLHEAARYGRLETCRLFIQNVEEKNPGDNRGSTPLHRAAYNGQLEICRLFIRNVENKNPRNIVGFTPLHGAAENGHLETCRLILDNVDVKNPVANNGDTPLNLARRWGHDDVCQLILQHQETAE